MQVHPQQISPGEPYNIFYFIRNHTDSGTYYVRAVVYDVETGVLLATHNLTQSTTNSRLFIKTAEAPTDPTGYGRNIVAIATVYTDSGYTAKSQDYEEQEQYFLVRNERMFGGGGIDFDYARIREILAEEADKAAKRNKPKEPEEINLQGVFGAIGGLQSTINRIPTDGFDPTETHKQLSQIMQHLRDLPIFEPTNLSGLEDAMYQIAAQLSVLDENLKKFGTVVIGDMDAIIKDLTPQLLDTVGNGVQEHMKKQELTIPFDKMFSTTRKPQKEEASHADISHLLAS